MAQQYGRCIIIIIVLLFQEPCPVNCATAGPRAGARISTFSRTAAGRPGRLMTSAQPVPSSRQRTPAVPCGLPHPRNPLGEGVVEGGLGIGDTKMLLVWMAQQATALHLSISLSIVHDTFRLARHHMFGYCAQRPRVRMRP